LSFAPAIYLFDHPFFFSSALVFPPFYHLPMFSRFFLFPMPYLLCSFLDFLLFFSFISILRIWSPDFQ
jgi:hypothetical protein